MFLLGTTVAGAGFEVQLLALVGNRGARRDGLGDEGVGAYDAVVADGGAAAQNGCVGINSHIVLNGGMPFGAPQALATPGGKAAQGDTLVDLHMAADDGGLADDDAGAVVDEEMVADGGAGVDVDTGDIMGMLRHNSGDHGHIQFIQHMSQPVHGNGVQAGIAIDDLVGIGGRRVAGKGSVHIGLRQRPDLGKPLHKGDAHTFRTLHHQGDLLIQMVHHILNEHGKIVLGIVDAIGFILGVAGI